MKSSRWVVLAALAAGPLFAQTAPPPLEFEVASVKPSEQQQGYQVNVGVHIDGAQVHISYFALKDYIRIAYQVKVYQVVGPDWLASARYDIDAKLPAGATRAQVPQMLQALLADRFQLKIHRESRDFPVYALAVASGGLKIKELPPDPDAVAVAGGGATEATAAGGPGGVTINYPGGSSFAFGNDRFEAHKLTMAYLADSLGHFLDRPVVDMTGLPGQYDFLIPLSPEDYRAIAIRSAILAGITLPPEAMRALEGTTDDSLFTAVASLGLRLEPRKAPLEALVVDEARKTPTEN